MALNYMLAFVAVVTLSVVCVRAKESEQPALQTRNGTIILEVGETSGDVIVQRASAEDISINTMAATQAAHSQLLESIVERMASLEADNQRLQATVVSLTNMVASNTIDELRAARKDIAQARQDIMMLKRENEALRLQTTTQDAVLTRQRVDIDTNQGLTRTLSDMMASLRSYMGMPVGTFTTVTTQINNAAELSAWRDSDWTVTDPTCVECSGTYPLYLTGDRETSDENGHYSWALDTLQSYIRYRFRTPFAIDGFRLASSAGHLRGRALFLHRSTQRIRAESDTCTSLPNDLCTSETMSAASVYVAPVKGVSPTNLIAAATDIMAVHSADDVFNLVADFTVEVFVRVAASEVERDSTYDVIISKVARDGLNEDTFAMYALHDRGELGTLGFHWKIEQASDGRDFGVSTPQQYQVNTWYHLVGVYANEDLIIYVDGQEVARETIGVVVAYTGPADLRIGSNRNTNHGGKTTFQGTIDEVRIWDRVLAPSEITKFGEVMTDEGLLLHLDFNNYTTATSESGISTYTVHDQSPLMHNATTLSIKTVPSLQGFGDAALFFAENQKLALFPTVPDGQYVAFIPVDNVTCDVNIGCPCDHPVATARVSDSSVWAILPPGQYYMCHKADSEYIVQPDVTVEVGELDPCVGVLCGANGHCENAQCVCEPGWTGTMCLVPDIVIPSGSEPQNALTSCSQAEASGVYWIKPVRATSAFQARCVDVNDKMWMVALQVDGSVSASTLLSPTGTGLINEDGGMAMFGEPELSSPSTYSRVVDEVEVAAIALVCLDEQSRVTTPLTTMLPVPTIVSKFVSATWPGNYQIYGDGTASRFNGMPSNVASTLFHVDTSGNVSYGITLDSMLCAGAAVDGANQLAVLVADM
eukprot:m.11287 g.11287  ORF g.11287 m.11287 type:complete len:875 (-) comp5693_c0_seq1:100-2724(-)